jgi:1-pyrroline-4-hydroxy-2-carboxylate deaminase
VNHAERPPWHGVLVAAALPLREDLSIDLDAYATHLRFLADHGCDGVVPNGSLGEYQTLTDTERADVVRVACAAARDSAGFRVVAGVSSYGSMEATRWAEQAAQAGCAAVMLLPPNAYRADADAVVAHFRAVAAVGLPVVAYNNPYDTRVDLTPALLARLHHDGLIMAVKEFSGDVRRGYEIAEQAPGLDLVVGSDDVVLELGIGGAVGWIAGIPNALPEPCVALWRAVRAGEIDPALKLYRRLHPLLRWDSKPEFVQAIKAAMDLAGRRGGPCRPPRSPLSAEQHDAVRAAVTQAGGSA